MLYNIIKVSLWVMYVCFYRRVYYLNSKNIPGKGTSVIFASNHSNGFMDPILIAAMQPRPIYFWVAAGEIPKNFAGKLMRHLHSIPIYRAKEGKDQMYKNKASFEETKQYLYSGWSSMWVAPEGRCFVQKRLEPIKKGTARLAFEMMEEKNWELDLQILPTGVNYTYHVLFRSEAYINIGTPLKVIDYKEQFVENKEAAIAQLANDMRQGIREKMVYIEEQNIELTEAFLPLLRHNFKRSFLPLYSSDPQFCHQEQQLANQITAATATQKETWANQLQSYQQALQEEQVSDFAVAQQNKRSILAVLLGLPIGVVGTVAGWIPHQIASKLRNKFVPFPAFSTSFAFTAAIVVWLLWSIIIMSIGAFFVGWWVLTWPFIMVFLQMLAYHYVDYTKEWYALFKFNNKKAATKDALQKKREALPLVGSV